VAGGEWTLVARIFALFWILDGTSTDPSSKYAL